MTNNETQPSPANVAAPSTTQEVALASASNASVPASHALQDSPVVGGPSSSGPSPLPGESPRAFEAFCAYLELGPSRRYVTVARKLGVTFRTVQRWAAQFDWRNRIIARAASWPVCSGSGR